MNFRFRNMYGTKNFKLHKCVCCIALANLLLRYVATLARQCGVMEYRKTSEIFILYVTRVCVCV